MPFASFFFLSRRVGDATAKNKKKKRLDYDEQSTITHTHCIGAHRRRRRRRRHHASRGTLKGARAWAIIKTALATRRRRDFRTWLHIPPPPPYPPHRLLTCDAIGREAGGGGQRTYFSWRLALLATYAASRLASPRKATHSTLSFTHSNCKCLCSDGGAMAQWIDWNRLLNHSATILSREREREH